MSKDRFSDPGEPAGLNWTVIIVMFLIAVAGVAFAYHKGVFSEVLAEDQAEAEAPAG